MRRDPVVRRRRAVAVPAPVRRRGAGPEPAAARAARADPRRPPRHLPGRRPPAGDLRVERRRPDDARRTSRSASPASPSSPSPATTGARRRSSQAGAAALRGRGHRRRHRSRAAPTGPTCRSWSAATSATRRPWSPSACARSSASATAPRTSRSSPAPTSSCTRWVARSAPPACPRGRRGAQSAADRAAHGAEATRCTSREQLADWAERVWVDGDRGRGPPPRGRGGRPVPHRRASRAASAAWVDARAAVRRPRGRGGERRRVRRRHARHLPRGQGPGVGGGRGRPGSRRVSSRTARRRPTQQRGRGGTPAVRRARRVRARSSWSPGRPTPGRATSRRARGSTAVRACGADRRAGSRRRRPAASAARRADPLDALRAGAPPSRGPAGVADSAVCSDATLRTLLDDPPSDAVQLASRSASIGRLRAPGTTPARRARPLPLTHPPRWASGPSAALEPAALHPLEHLGLASR